MYKTLQEVVDKMTVNCLALTDVSSMFSLPSSRSLLLFFLILFYFFIVCLGGRMSFVKPTEVM